MKRFKYIQPRTLEEAVSILGKYNHKARIIAGGTDLLGLMKNRISPNYPEIVISLKSITGLEGITRNDKGVKISALTRLCDVATSPILGEEFQALRQATCAVGSPQIRCMGTIGGNLCQDIRCWYFRAPKNYFYCLRKSDAPKSSLCYAVKGDNRYHSIFGPIKKCFAVNPSDAAPALIVLGATFTTTKRQIDAAEYFTANAEKTTVLDPDEILTEIFIPRSEKGTKSNFSKFSLRKSIDFPIVNCAIKIVTHDGLIKNARICINGVYNVPYRPLDAEGFLIGRKLNKETANEVSHLSLSKAKALSGNEYIVFITKDLVKKTILAS